MSFFDDIDNCSKQYKLVRSSDLEAFEAEVTEKLNAEWAVIGGVDVSVIGGAAGFMYVQAMWRYVHANAEE